MNPILNLTASAITEEQIKDGVVDLDTETRKSVLDHLKMNGKSAAIKAPVSSFILASIARKFFDNLIIEAIRNEKIINNKHVAELLDRRVMINGHPLLLEYLVKDLRLFGLTPTYSISELCSVDVPYEDGTVLKTTHLVHIQLEECIK
jgi:hypothetical protein